MAKIIIGVHGLANKPLKSVLHAWWLDSINEGLQWIGASVRLPKRRFHVLYWADSMYVRPLEPGADPPFRLVEGYTPATSQPPEGHDRSFDWAIATAGDAVDRVLDRVGFLDNIADVLLAAKLRDLAVYWDETRAFHGRQTAKQFLCGKLRDLLKRHVKAGHQILLIAHSMGSIIAFDTLTANPGLAIDTFVTIGAPLGLQRVKRRLARSAGQLWPVVPSNIGKWLNLADRRDPVAVDSSLRTDFLTAQGEEFVQDDLVINDYRYKDDDGTWKANPHKAYGYLRCPELSRAMRDFLS